MICLISTPALRGRIRKILSEKINGVPVAGTVEWIAARLTGTRPTKSQVRAVEAELSALGAMARTLRSGVVLWKLPNKHHAAWQGLVRGLSRGWL